jgi:hypothetical protein
MYLFKELLLVTLLAGFASPLVVGEASARGGPDKGYLLHNQDNCPLDPKTPCFPRMP